MPHDSRNDSLERIRELPGPGSYELFDTPIKTQAPKAKFGRAGRDNHSKSQNRLPGPGEYSHSDTLGCKLAIKAWKNRLVLHLTEIVLQAVPGVVVT